MRNHIAALVVILVALVVGAGAMRAPAVFPNSAVKVEMAGGHGSGVYIGRNLIVTATHVIRTEKSVKIKTELGEILTGEVLWANQKYDVALIRTPTPQNVHASHLSCTVPASGDDVMLRGNPTIVEFVTAWGKIAGTVREMLPWASVVPTNAAIIPGMSGGPVFDKAGNVVGISVGVLTVPTGLSVSLVGMGAIVPGKTICELMGRA